ncbi:MAG: DNA mismatch repair protein MutS [Bacillota bacterium]
MSELTPMMQQYLEIKAQHQEAILFFRLGDFYEMFLDDALLASRELEITLTSREGGGDRRVPMCGVPYHAANSYISRLVQKGYAVVICEQVEDPRLAKGLVKREVTRIITPGTILEEGALDAKTNNYLVAVCEQEGAFGLAYTDLSTGEFRAVQFDGITARQRLLDEIGRLSPAECLLEPSTYEDQVFRDQVTLQASAALTLYPEKEKSNDECWRVLRAHLGDEFALDSHWAEATSAVQAAASILGFLIETQKISPSHINRLVAYSAGEYMTLDYTSRRNLELTATIRDKSRTGSLLWVLDRTATAMGARALRQWVEQPLLDQEKINRRLEAVEELLQNGMLRLEIRQLLKEVYDLERLTGRIACGHANARDLQALRVSLEVVPNITGCLAETGSFLLLQLAERLDPLEEEVLLLQQAIVETAPLSVRDGGMIRSGYHPEVDRLRAASSNGKGWIAGLETKEREKSGIKTLKIGYNKVFGYYIEVTKSHLAAVPTDYIRKQTLVNAERFITQELKEFEELVVGAEDRLMQLEYQLFVEIRERVGQAIPRLQKTARAMAELDVLASLAEAAGDNGYVRPTVEQGDVIEIGAGRHPVVEKVLAGEGFVPNDTHLDCRQQQVMIITGPNMAGKSTYMRQVALIVLMAQVGSFVPAQNARIGLVDRIFTRVGAADDLATGQSTFMVEMRECQTIVSQATPNSLLLMDEVGRGTSTYDGISIARAIIEHVHDRIGAKTLFSTHYHELTDLEKKLARAVNYTVAVKEKGKEIVFLRLVLPGKADRSYGIHVAELAGLPETITGRAKEILDSLESKQINASGISPTPLRADPRPDKHGMDSQHHQTIEELLSLDVLSMTPLEAINKLYQLQSLLRSESTAGELKITRGRR